MKKQSVLDKLQIEFDKLQKQKLDLFTNPVYIPWRYNEEQNISNKQCGLLLAMKIVEEENDGRKQLL